MSPTSEPKRLGAFLGVFTPTILTILGVVMFLRVGWLVAVVGLVGALAVVILSHAITALTSLSVSSLATNDRVGVGGAYFLISRSLGLEVGGAVGIPLYLSQVLSITLYSYGLAESLQIVAPDLPLSITAAVVVVVVTAVASRSAELTLKLQLPIMILIGASILSLLAGAEGGVDEVGRWGRLGTELGDVSFMEAFAVFFPAVTGILAGVSLSGDLEDPGKAIPAGVFGAVVVGGLVYLVVPVVLAGSASADALYDNSLVWLDVAAVPSLVLPGMFGAILSSAFGSALGAPRTLQALADDGVVPAFLGRIDERSGEPVLGVYLSGGLALVAVWLGSLNAVASLVTMFFLTTYGALNAVALVETLVADPHYRPRVRVPWWAPTLGFAGCLLAMFAINPMAGAVAVVIEVLLFLQLQRRALEAPFGDARNGLALSLAHRLVVWFTDARKDPRSWRPNVLVCTSDLDEAFPTVQLADDLGDTQGILTVVELVTCELDAIPQPSEHLPHKRALLQRAGVDAFCEMTAVPQVDDAAFAAVVQAHGVGGMNANTVMLRWRDGDLGELTDHLRRMRMLCRLEKCTVLHRLPPEGVDVPSFLEDPVIMVWWKGMESNGDLMLLLAHLFTRGRRFRSARVLLRTVVTDPSEAEAWRESAVGLSDRIRMTVDADAIVRGRDESVTDVIRQLSRRAHLVMMGLSSLTPGEEEPTAARIAAMCEGLPETLLVRNAGPFRGRLM